MARLVKARVYVTYSFSMDFYGLQHKISVEVCVFSDRISWASFHSEGLAEVAAILTTHIFQHSHKLPMPRYL
ncbi:hypothetical protein H6G91_33920 [Nostoc muscorum FACHB-395]|nr:hypothetical protein [Desmonostoc muscorum FACHB-395]